MSAETVLFWLWFTLRKKLFWAYRGIVDPLYRHGHMEAFHLSLWYLHVGSVTVEIGGKYTTASAGQWMLVPPLAHQQDFTDDAEVSSVRFVFDRPSGECLLNFDQAWCLQGSVGLQNQTSTLIRVVEKSYGNSQRNMLPTSQALPSMHLDVEAHFLFFLKEFYLCVLKEEIPLCPLGQQDDRVSQCVWLVMNSPLSTQWTETRLAEEAGLSVSQLNRCFQADMGMTANAWVQQYRLGRARDLLPTGIPVKEIAYGLGFSSPQHFSTWFKKWTGYPPSQIRRKQKC